MGTIPNRTSKRSIRIAGRNETRSSPRPNQPVTQSQPTAGIQPAAPASIPPGPKKSQTNFLAHDTRNWLTVLQVYCDLMQTPGATVQEYRIWMKELAAAVDRGQGLVLSLLDALQLDTLRRDNLRRDTVPNERSHPDAIPLNMNSQSGRASASGMAIDLANAVRRRLPVLQRMAGPAILVEADLAPDAVWVLLSDEELERILLNLASNALDAMPHGGTLKISLRAQSTVGAPGILSMLNASNWRSSHFPLTRASVPRRTVVLQISDTGTGIAPELLPRIFDSGVSSKTGDSDVAGQRGFGLAIVRELTTMASGSIQVTSGENGGSCFQLSFPEAEEPLSTESGTRGTVDRDARQTVVPQ